MAATPPRPASPVSAPMVVPKAGHSLQISPNLEALLEHDELMRRNSSSPTSVTSTRFPPIGLPPPPPRKAQGGRKASEAVLTTRSKEERRKKSAGMGSDCWADGLPSASTTTAGSGEESGSGGSSSSRSVTPNPYINPTPVWRSINTPSPQADVVDGAATSRTLGSDRPLNKILWMGRDSLSLFSPSGCKSGRRQEHDAVRSYERVSTGDTTSRSYSTDEPSTRLPHLSLPPSNATTHDYLSFIDLLSPSTSEDSSMPDNPRQLGPITIPPTGVYSISRRDSSPSPSLASMRFAEPPSPADVALQRPSPVYPRSDTPTSSVTLSSMKFAPPSPSIDRVPTRLQPLSGPPSPCSPLEFAAPPSPPTGAINKPILSIPPGPPSDRGKKLKTKRAFSASPRPVHHLPSSLPPTTNQLGANERADRIRRNRKLARVFGRTPGADEPLTDVEEPRSKRSSSLAALLTKPRNHRHAVSVSVSVKTSGRKTEPSTPWQTDDPWSPDGRRHSTPLASSFTLYVNEDGKDARGAAKRMDSADAASTRSFIDLSEEDVRDDDTSVFSFFTPHRRRLHQSSSFPSLVELFDSNAQADAERRRKREKLARLHRFLGSRVPPEAVSGCVRGPPLPPLAIPEPANQGLRGSKSASADEFDRGKEKLDEKEKALNVRRAQKMERVFGTPPPQVLFRTRPTASQPASPTHHNPYVLTLDLPSSSRNPNQSAYVGKTTHRPGPSDSTRCLLPNVDDAQNSPSSLAQSFADSFGDQYGFQEVLAQSSVYINYQHSLNSLVDIIDRDDRKSLVELHRFLHGAVEDSPSEEDVPLNTRRFSNAASFKSERRHSLPSSASMTSLSSEFNSPEASRLQIRRRKAAKLTHFFGVDYRELIHDILESVEKGVEEERKQGTLQPQEVEVLMHRVRGIRSINEPFSS